MFHPHFFFADVSLLLSGASEIVFLCPPCVWMYPRTQKLHKRESTRGVICCIRRKRMRATKSYLPLKIVLLY